MEACGSAHYWAPTLQGHEVRLLPAQYQVHQGKMHACCHGGDMTMLLAATKHLATHRQFDGTVYLILQPGEEGSLGLPINHTFAHRSCPLDPQVGTYDCAH